MSLAVWASEHVYLVGTVPCLLVRNHFKSVSLGTLLPYNGFMLLQILSMWSNSFKSAAGLYGKRFFLCSLEIAFCSSSKHFIALWSIPSMGGGLFEVSLHAKNDEVLEPFCPRGNIFDSNVFGSSSMTLETASLIFVLPCLFIGICFTSAKDSFPTDSESESSELS